MCDASTRVVVRIRLDFRCEREVQSWKIFMNPKFGSFIK